MRIWPDEPYFFRRRGEKVAMPMHTYYTDIVVNPIVPKLIKIPLPTSLDQEAKWDKTMNTINTK